MLEATPTAADGTLTRSLPYGLYQQLLEADTGLSHLLARLSAPVALAWDRSAMRAGAEFISPDAFETLGVVPALGQTLDPGSSGTGVVISYRLWRSRFGGDPSVVGRSVSVGGQPFTVVGVAPAAFTGLVVGLEIDAWLPLENFPAVFHQPQGIFGVGIHGPAAPGGVSRPGGGAGRGGRRQVALVGWRC